MNLNEIIREIDLEYGKRKAADMEVFIQQQLRRVAEHFGVKSREVVALLNELGGYYRTMSRYAESEKTFLQAGAILAEVLGEGHPDYATTLNNLAGVYRLMDEQEKAESLFRKALEIYKANHMSESFLYSSGLNNLGLLYLEKKAYEKAAALFLEANEIAKREKNSPVIYATGLGNLANAYLGMSQNETARKLLIEAVTVYKSAKKEGNPHYASALNSLGAYYLAVGEFEKAEPLFQKVLSIRAEAFGTDHHEYKKALANQKELTHKKGELAEKRSEEPMSSQLNEMSRMDAALMSFLQFSTSVLCKKFPSYCGRIAAGLVGEGSECYGFEDQHSRDHDWEAGFDLWLTEKDAGEIGEALQREYLEFFRGKSRRGVRTIEAFYQKTLGVEWNLAKESELVKESELAKVEEWISVAEWRFAEATNGKVFVDPLGQFSEKRKALQGHYPEDVRRFRLAESLCLMAQAGQYNFPRSLQRGELVTAHYALNQFMNSAMASVYLLNKKYKPYYKWMHRGLKSLPKLGREIYEKLDILASSGIPMERKSEIIEEISSVIGAAVRREGLSNAQDSFLMEHGKSVFQEIKNEELRKRPIQLGERY